MNYDKFVELMTEKPEGYPVFILDGKKVVERTMTCFKLTHGSTNDFSGYMAEIYVRGRNRTGQWVEPKHVFLSKEELLNSL